MGKRNAAYVLGNRGPDAREAPVRQDPVVRMMMERLGPDSPLIGAVTLESMLLRRLGVEITTDVMSRILDKVEDAHRRDHAVVPAQVMPKRRASRGRFRDIEVADEVVYYMRIGNRVKIGTSTKLVERLKAINPEELMAVEAGGHGKERLRHEQFAELRTHGEWFRYEGALVEHVESIRQAQP